MSKQKYNGFGVELSAAEWARVLGLPYQTVWSALSCGATPEGIAKAKNRKVDPEALRQSMPKYETKTTPKPVHKTARRGKRLERTRELILDLLDVSGYDADPDDVAVVAGTNYNQTVLVWGKPLGRYNYGKDWLSLSGGGIKLESPRVPDQQIQRNHLGLWEVHPETHGRIVAQILDTN